MFIFVVEVSLVSGFFLFGNQEGENSCPLAAPCKCSYKDVPVNIWNQPGPLWKPKLSTVYRHGIDCSSLNLDDTNIPLVISSSAFQKENFALLDFSYNKISQFPKNYFSKLSKLLALNLTENSLYKIPDAVKYNANLIILRLSYNRRLQVLKSPFAKMAKLENLYLDHCNVKHLRRSVFQGLVSLRILRLDHNGMHYLEAGVFTDAPALEILAVNNNRLKSLSDLLLGLKELQQLDVGNNLFTEIPSEAFKNVPKLKILNLARCRITTLHSASFYHLKQLTDLDLGHNLIEKLPNEVFEKLEVIETLHLSRNKLKEMTYEQFIRMPLTLKTLNLASNDLTLRSFDENVTFHFDFRIFGQNFVGMDVVLFPKFNLHAGILAGIPSVSKLGSAFTEQQSSSTDP